VGKQQKSRVNDFVLKIANVNGTGSASANSLVMKTVFRMGIPVSGKNFFPSNIQGLPTWYEIRVSKDGYLARSGAVDIMIAMNSQTYARDLQEVAPGGVLLYDSTWPRDRLLSRSDIEIIGVPLARMCNERFANARTRILMKNMAYVGVLAALLELDRAVIVELVKETFAKKPALIESNLEAFDLGAEHARAHLTCPLPQRVKPLGKTAGHIMIDGNTAAALGCLYAGATVGAWYPITPSTSLMDAFKSFCERYRKDPQTGERRLTVELTAEQPAVALSYHMVARRDPDYLAYDLLSSILGSGESSRLFRDLVYDQQVASGAAAWIDGTEHQGLLTLWADVIPGKTPEQTIARIDAVIAELVTKGVTKEEVDKARNQALASQARQLTTNGDRAVELLIAELMDGDYQRIFRLARDYDRVTAADVDRVARARLTPQNRTIGVLVPKDDTASLEGGEK